MSDTDGDKMRALGKRGVVKCLLPRAKAQERRGLAMCRVGRRKNAGCAERDDEQGVSRLSSDSEGWSNKRRGKERQEVTDDGHTETTAATGTMQCAVSELCRSPFRHAQTKEGQARVERRGRGRRPRFARPASLRSSK